MSDKLGPQTRRKVLKSSSLALPLPLIGAASAKSDQPRSRTGTQHQPRNGSRPKQGQSAVAFQDGRLEVNISKQQTETVTAASEQSEGIDEIPDEASPIPVDALQQTVEEFNQAIEEGDVKIIDKGEGHVAIPAEAINARREARGEGGR